MVDNFFISITKKVENFTFEKICTHEKIKKEIKQNLLKLVHTKIITHKVLHETNFYWHGIF